MKILSVNAGSSSLKFTLFDMPEEKELISGVFERIGIENSFYTIKLNGEKIKKETELKDHKAAFELLVKELIDNKIVDSLDEIAGIGHRIVQGGSYFDKTVLATEDNISIVEKLSSLAPLHNPAGIMGIEACQKVMPGKPMVGVFDTAFHQTLDPKAYMYAIPYEYYEKYKIRKYGFHGTSHRFVSNRVAEIVNKPIEDLKIITCHLGQGASLCAVKNGKSVDTSMGLTPLAGVPMGSRSGDIDPSIVTFLMEKEGLSAKEIDNILNKKSGKLGLSVISADDRDIEKEILNGNKRAELAIDNFIYQVVGYIGRFAAQMNGVDVITFAGGVGENGIDVREKVCAYLEFLGVKINTEANNCRGKEVEISTPDSKVKVFVIPTNEELMIARDTKELVTK